MINYDSANQSNSIEWQYYRGDEVLPWDGSHLGEFTNDNINIWMDSISYDPESTLKTQKVELIQLSIPYKNQIITFICEIKKFVDSIPILIDELKSMFKLHKRGIHTISLPDKSLVTRKIKKFIIMKIYHFIENGNFICPMQYNSLYQFDTLIGNVMPKIKQYSFISQIRDIIMFSYICGVKFSCKNIHIKYTVNKQFVYPLMYYNKTLNSKTNNISSSVIQKWFDKDEIDHNTLTNNFKKLLGINDENQDEIISAFQSNFKSLFTKFSDIDILNYWYIIDNINNLFY